MNAGTILVCLVIVAIVAAIIGKSIHNHKHHKGGCGCGCEGCANSSMCHPQTDADQK